MLGGRAAEDLVFSEPSGGASNDLARVSAMARRMVCELGMRAALGNMSYAGASYDGSSYDAPGSSEQEKALINSEARRLVDEAYERARDVLAGSRATLDRIASALLEVARQAGHSVAVCDRHYAGIFDAMPTERVSAEAAIRAAREPGVRGVCALFDASAEG